MSAAKQIAPILGTDVATAEKIGPLLSDAAAALAEGHVPTEAEIHEIVGGAFRFTENESLESEDTDRQLEDAMKSVSKWREGAQVYLSGASVLLRRAKPASNRFDAKKRVLAAFRAVHAGPACERFYFTRENAIEFPEYRGGAGAIAPPPETGAGFFRGVAFEQLIDTRPDELTDGQRDLLVRLLAIPSDPRSPETARIVDALARGGERVLSSVLGAMHRPEESAKSAGGKSGGLFFGIRRLVPKLPAAPGERILRSALEAGWLEWIDRPLLDPPLEAGLRERLLKEFGTRQDPRGNPYRPTEPWFYNLEAS
jgi:hypothetical protein